MRFSLKLPKGILALASLTAVLLAAMIAGCDSSAGPDMSNADTKKNVDARAQAVADEDAKINADAKQKGLKGSELKSIKGGIKPPDVK
jgi:hypothetical protein